MKYIKAYTATWCGPCKMIKKELAKLESENNIKVEYRDVDEFRQEALDLGIKSVPTLLYMEGDIEILRTTGYSPGKNILDKLVG